ncbi:efflux transporter outer membrane subunit [Pseudomonas aeruginosa]|uniref:efflux transporter outer membrane subunit n=1 Tax=Pseudomonas aeruginosa TaxID=287 RepID=UPI0034D20F45
MSAMSDLQKALRGIGLGLMGGLLGACVPGDITSKAHLQDPRAFADSAAVAAAARSAQWPSERWWEAWSDPQLDALLARAVAGSPDLRAAQARLEQANAQARIAGADRLPQLGSSAGLNRERISHDAEARSGETVWANSIGLDLTWELDLWGRSRAAAEGALSLAKSMAAEQRGVQLALQTAVVRAYVQLALQYALRDTALAVDQQSRENRDIIAKRHAAGLASALELSQANTQLAIGRNEIEAAEQQIALQRNQVAALIGQGPGAGDSITRPQLRLNVPLVLPENLQADLLGHRPDIVSLRWQVEAASTDITVARAAFYPNINLTAMASMVSSAASSGVVNFMNHDTLGGSYGFAVSLPLFDGGRRRGQYGVAMSSYDEAVENYNSAVLSAMREVADQVVSLQSLQKQQANAQDSMMQAQQAYDLALRGYRAGVTEYLDVLTTQTTLERQRQQLDQVRSDRFDAWAQLIDALGGGWTVPNAAVQSKEATDAPS